MDLIYVYTFLKIRVLVSSERSVCPYSNKLVEHLIFGGNNEAIEANRMSLSAVHVLTMVPFQWTMYVFDNASLPMTNVRV